jgi:MarR family transcriptional regulator, organic hydroperoxide resistance regulator
MMTEHGAGAPETAAVITALQQATHAVIHHLAVSLERWNLTASEQNALAALAAGGVLSVGELAVATGTKPSTLTSVLDRLESKGHLERDVDRADRRSVVLILTPVGHRAAAAIQDAMAGLEHSALAALGKQQLAGFFAVTSALREAAR